LYQINQKEGDIGSIITCILIKHINPSQ